MEEKGKCYSVMLFFSEKELGTGFRTDIFYHTKTVTFGQNFLAAAEFYSNNAEWVEELMEVL